MRGWEVLAQAVSGQGTKPSIGPGLFRVTRPPVIALGPPGCRSPECADKPAAALDGTDGEGLPVLL